MSGKGSHVYNSPIFIAPAGFGSARADLIREAADTIDALAEVAAIFLGEDARFHVAVGGNPNAIEEMLEKSRSALSRAKG